MKSLGFVIGKNALYYSLIEGTNKSNSNIIEKGKIPFQVDSDKLMVYFERTFKEYVFRLSPNAISYKVTLQANLSQIDYLYFPFGILRLICEQNDIAIYERSISWINKKVKGEKRIDELPKYFPDFTEKSAELRQATLIALYVLED